MPDKKLRGNHMNLRIKQTPAPTSSQKLMNKKKLMSEVTPYMAVVA